MKANICYKCGREATSREHVPPLCIFPTRKDLGLDFRTNLITVPSCEEHNLRKSCDDEFLMACLAGIVGNNIVGYLLTKTKVRRTLERRPNDLISKIIEEHKELFVQTNDGIVFPLLSGKPDMMRLLKCFDHIVCGLYFHEYGRVFKGEMRTLVNFVEHNSKNTQSLTNFIQARFTKESDQYPKKGNNPLVFYYQIVPRDEFGLILFKLTFYEGTDVFVCLKDEDATEPHNLAMKFIRGGFPTTIEYDGKQYKFNN